jgi:photosystem II stability/assembly factor-like uncharacterized protein
MNRSLILIAYLAAIVSLAFAQWHPQNSNTDANLNGLGIVNANVVWAFGTGGTFVRSIDGCETWRAGTVAGAEKLDFRDVHAIDAETACVMSIGKGNEARIYKTTDGSKNWLLEYTEQNPKTFLDWQDRVGSIEPGKFANLVAVAGDPRADITELE